MEYTAILVSYKRRAFVVLPRAWNFLRVRDRVKRCSFRNDCLTVSGYNFKHFENFLNSFTFFVVIRSKERHTEQQKDKNDDKKRGEYIETLRYRELQHAVIVRYIRTGQKMRRERGKGIKFKAKILGEF